jgi:hypothetical protein
LQQQAVHPAGKLFGQIVFKAMGTFAYSGYINAGANSHRFQQMDGVLGSYIAGGPRDERAAAHTRHGGIKLNNAAIQGRH